MAFNQQEQQIIQFGKQQGKSADEIANAVSKYRTTTRTPVQESTLGDRFRSGVTEAGQDIAQTGSAIGGRFTEAADKFSELQRSDDAIGSKIFQTFGLGAGAASQSFGDVFTGLIKLSLDQEQENVVKQKVTDVAQGVIQNPNVEPVIKKSVETFQRLDPETQRNLSALFNVGMLGLDVYGSALARRGIAKTGELGARVVSEGLETAGDVGRAAVKGTREAVESIPNRITSIRNRLRGITDDVVGGVKKTGDDVAETAAKGARFADNANVTGSIDDIKIMIGLPDSTPAVDLTFRAVKPRIAKGVDLNRIKSQMGLANQTIVESGFKPTNIREYADAVYDTKKAVWEQIQSRLDAGQEAGTKINLTDVANKILDKAEDPALLRTSPAQAEALAKIAEDLISKGDSVDILEAERIKQLLNAELSGSFGQTDLSAQVKEAKKLITRDIGEQLDEALADLTGDFRDLKIKYGSLSAIEEDILKRAIVWERRNPEGLADMLNKTEAAALIAFGGPKQKLQAIARLTVGRQLKKANDVDDLIRRAFEKLSK